jgi:hypothetical protein
MKTPGKRRMRIWGSGNQANILIRIGNSDQILKIIGKFKKRAISG